MTLPGWRADHSGARRHRQASLPTVGDIGVAGFSGGRPRTPRHKRTSLMSGTDRLTGIGVEDHSRHRVDER
jgi:hypothetical protein